MMLVLLVPIVVSVTAAPLQQNLDDRPVSPGKDTLPVLPEVGVGSVKVDSKKPSRKKTRVNSDPKETKTSQDLFLIPNQDDRLSTLPRTFPVLWESGLSSPKESIKRGTTAGSNRNETGTIKPGSGTTIFHTATIKSQGGITNIRSGTMSPIKISKTNSIPQGNEPSTGRRRQPTGTIESKNGTTSYQPDFIRSQSDTTNSQSGIVTSKGDTPKLQQPRIKSLTKPSVSKTILTPQQIEPTTGIKRLLTGNIKSKTGTKTSQPGTTKSQTGTNKLQPGTESSTEVTEPNLPSQEIGPQESEVRTKVMKRGRKHKAFFLNYPFVPQTHHHYPNLPDYDASFEDCNFRIGTKERTPGGEKKYQDSNIYYIRLPPTPYVFVPGLGYISQPPRYSPPPISPHITHVRPARPPTIYQPHVNPFIKVPIDFVSNGKPTSVYEWPSNDARPGNHISNLDKGPYVFNGRPSSIYLLRPDGSQTASQPIRYTDYQDNSYY